MTSGNRSEEISPAVGDRLRPAMRSQTPSIGNITITGQEMSARMYSIRATNIWNMESITCRPGSLSRKEEVSVNMPVTDE